MSIDTTNSAVDRWRAALRDIWDSMGPASRYSNAFDRWLAVPDLDVSSPLVRYSIAAALARDTADWKPEQRSGVGRPRLSCTEIVVLMPDGSRHEYPAGLLPTPDPFSMDPSNQPPWIRYASSITATLNVTMSNKEQLYQTVALDFSMHGVPHMEQVWVTEQYDWDAEPALWERIHEAFLEQYIDRGGHEDDNDYEAHCAHLEICAKDGNDALFMAELQYLCDQFWPIGSPPSDSVTVSNSRHSLTWLPVQVCPR